MADVYVDIAAANCSTGTGTAGNPVCSIGAAIALAAPGDTIRIAPGVYVETLSLPFDLDLIGTAGASGTTLNGGGTAISPNVSVVTIPSSVTVSIEGLRILNGASGDLNPVGRGIQVAGTLALSHSTISSITSASGAAIYASPGSSLEISNCRFTGNRISSNYGEGGALNIRQGSCTIANSSFSGNLAREGGAIWSSNSQLEIMSSELEGNRASAAVQYATGGAVFQEGGSLLLMDSTVEGNRTEGGPGGGLSLNGGQFSIINSTISANLSSFSNYFVPTPGGGVFCSGGTTGTILNSTITENYAVVSDGGGVASSGSISVGNSIIAGNAGNTFSPPFSGEDLFGSFTSLGHNLIGDAEGGYATSGFTNGVNNDIVGSVASPIDPMLGPLANNGGTTRTHALLPGSPALDAGDPFTFESEDQRGILRPQGIAPDIGAYEEISTLESSTLCNGDGGDGMGCTPCPCGNELPAGTVGGCLHSGNLGGRLLRGGSSSLTTGDLRFEARSLPANTASILLSGAAQAPSNPASPCFGLGSGFQDPIFDGLRCVVQDIRRHGVRPADGDGSVGATTNGWGSPNSFFGFNAFLAGQTRYFQIIFRDDLAGGCMTGLNTTQAAEVLFQP